MVQTDGIFSVPITAPGQPNTPAVAGENTSNNGIGVNGTAGGFDGTGVRGQGQLRGVEGLALGGGSLPPVGVHGVSGGNVAVRQDIPIGVLGESSSGIGVAGFSFSNDGVWGQTSATNQSGVTGFTELGSAAGITGINKGGGLAGDFDGKVRVTGFLEKAGGGFKIDHPLDPANKYLYHSFVESPDMKNIYDGVVMLDNKGKAEIELPNCFGILNKDFRYQLTAIGAPGPNLYIAEKISEATTINYRSSSGSSNNNNNSRFKIAGGTSGMEVSWQVTGIRKDPWANANRIEVEEDKPDKERGYYLHPDLYRQPEEKMINYSIISRKVNRPEIAEVPPPKMRTS